MIGASREGGSLHRRSRWAKQQKDQKVMATKDTVKQTLDIDLKFQKETKGTYVYTMKVGDTEIGGIYLQKLLFKSKPGDVMKMTISE